MSQKSINISKKFYIYADKVVNEEINSDSQNSLKKTLWEKMGRELESVDYPRNQISKKIEHTIEEKLKESLGYPVKINTAYYYRIMAENKWQDTSFDRSNKIDPPEGASNSSITEYPEGIAFEILELCNIITKNNKINYENIINKTKFNENSILKLKKSTVDSDRRARLKDAKKLINTRRKAVERQVQKFFNDVDLEKIKTELSQTIAEQEKLAIYFNDRMSITLFQKVMARYAVDIGFEQNHIARLLNITSKHMKINIYSDETKEEHLLAIKWFDSCANCGVNLSEFYESKVKQFRKRKSLKFKNYEIDLLKTNSYQKQIISLKKENFDLKQKLKGLNK